MVEMDSKIKGIILNHTLKSYSITPIEGANVLKVTMRFYGGYKYKSPSRRGRTGSGRRSSWPDSRGILPWCQSPSLSLASPFPVALGGSGCLAIAIAFITQAEELMVEVKKQHDMPNHLAQETEEAEKKRDRMCNWVCNLLDQRYNVKVEIWWLEPEVTRMKEELTQVEDRKKELEVSGLSLMPVDTFSV